MRYRMLLLGVVAAVATTPATAGAQSSGTIVYDSEAAPIGIVAVSAAGGTPTQLAQSGQNPSISPDGDTVAYLADSGGINNPFSGTLMTVPIGGGSATSGPAAMPGAGAPAWSKNGSTIAYIGPTGSLMTVSASGGTPKQVVAGSLTAGQASFPAYLPNGQLLYLWRQPPTGVVAPGTGATLQLRMVSASGTGSKPVAVTLPSSWSIGGSLDVSPSGRTLTIEVHQPPPAQFQPSPLGTAIVPIKGGTAQVISGPTGAAFSPNGTQLCATVISSAAPTINVYSVDGRQLSTLGLTGTDCSWGP